MKSLVTKINESMNKNISTIKIENRDKSILDVKVNSYEEAVDVFAKFFGVEKYKIINCENRDKSYKIGPKFYTKDGYKISKYIQFMVGRAEPSNARFTISQHGNNLVIQLIYYAGSKINDFTWAYGLYNKDSYKYGKETLLDWINKMGEGIVNKNDYKYIIAQFN